MFSKTLFLAVLFCFVVFVNAGPQLQQNLRLKRQTLEKVKAFGERVKQRANEFVDKIANAWKSFWNRITGKESAAKDQRISELEAQLVSVQTQGLDEIKKLNAEWKIKLDEATARVERAETAKKEILRAALDALEKLRQEANDDMDRRISAYDKRADDLAKQIKQTVDG